MRAQLAAIAVCALLFQHSAAAAPIDKLASDSPELYKLYKQYEGYAKQFGEYAQRQGFRGEYARLGTVVHEMLHVASAVHQGFYINGIYYEPYLNVNHWPSLRNEDITPHMTASEIGNIYLNYMMSTPKNSLGNIVDEINAYSHVLRFICLNEPVSCRTQANNLLGHLNVVEAYLRVLRTARPNEYLRFRSDRLGSGALDTVIRRAWNALLDCGLPASRIPSSEAKLFLQK